MDNLFKNIADKLILLLKENEIDAYIWHEATTGSIYIRFNDERMCSIRIGDHEGKEKLKYKFNIRTDLKLSKGIWKKDDNIWRYYLPIHLWKEIIPILIKRKEEVKNWNESKYKYNIPSFKK